MSSSENLQGGFQSAEPEGAEIPRVLRWSFDLSAGLFALLGALSFFTGDCEMMLLAGASGLGIMAFPLYSALKKKYSRGSGSEE